MRVDAIDVPRPRGRPAPRLRFAEAFHDLWEGLAHVQLWATLAWFEIKGRYRRSILGPFWITLSMALFLVGLGFLYSSLLGYDLAEYLPYLTLGFIFWSLINGTVGAGSLIFTGAAGVIRQVRVPVSLHFFRVLARQLLTFLHVIVLAPIVLAVFQVWPGSAAILAIPGFALTFLVCSGVALTLAIISTRYRDVQPMVGSVMRVAFFFTPIIWKAESSAKGIFVHWNPFYYLLEVVRAPLLGTVPPLKVWLVVALLAVIAWTFALLFYARFRHRIAFWA